MADGSVVTPPEKLQKLRQSLHAKAKTEPKYRFYSLWDKVYREDVLRHAYRACRTNRGASGVDGETFTDIEEHGLESWLGNLQQELQGGTYAPAPLLRVWIPKSNGGKRPLGIPTIRDRVVQMAVLLVIGPILEADLPRQQYGFRVGLDAKLAIRRVFFHITQHGRHEVVDGDGHDQAFDAQIVNYADDFVICCQPGNGKAAMMKMREMMERLGLTVNEQKTRLVKLPEESFDFLGYTFCRQYARKGRAFLGTRPSRKAMTRVLQRVHEETSVRWITAPVEKRVEEVNEVVRGWCGYFNQGPVDREYHLLTRYIAWRFRRWLAKKHKRRATGNRQYPYEYLFGTLGLYMPQTPSLAGQERRREDPGESRMREICKSGSTRGRWKRSDGTE